MFRINAAQSEAFQERAHLDFMELAYLHLREALPHEMAQYEAEEDAFVDIDLGLARAADEGLGDPEDCLRFLELWTLVGPTLGEEQAHQPAIDLLLDDAVVASWPAQRHALADMCVGELPNLDDLVAAPER